MTTKENHITCPECGAEIDVNEVLYHQLEEKIKKNYEKKLIKNQQAVQEQLNVLKAKEEKLNKEKEKLNNIIEEQVKSKLKIETQKIEKNIRQKITEEISEEIQTLQKELNLKSEQLKELNRTKAEIERLKREKEEQEEKIRLEKEKEFTQKLSEEKKKIRQLLEEETTLKIRELEKQLEEQKEIAKEALRKAEQGSMQRQGEIQELEIEKILRETHKYDDIVEVKKGQQGADIIQVVKTENGIECGKIYYESKRTKNFNDNWLQKLRDDNLSVKADVLVLVTETMPDNHKTFFYKDGVWICSLWEVKGLSIVLRYGLLKVHSVSITNQGKETKMEMLYNYLTSQEFSGQFGAIIEGFKMLQENYADEKLKMQKIWKEREKQLEKILTNAVSFYGSIKGIAGASIPNIKMLEDGQQNALDE
ncbi:MAG: DUF2130 domain-containing protein [Bacteroidia bacterium]